MPRKPTTSIKVPEQVHGELVALQAELSHAGLGALPAAFRPAGLGLGEIIGAALKSLQSRIRKRRA